MKDQKTCYKRGPKDQDPTKIMGQKDQNSAKWGGGGGVKMKKKKGSYEDTVGRLVKSAEHTHTCTLINI